MAIVTTDDRHYNAIADAIRDNLEATEKYDPAHMAQGVQQACSHQFDLGYAGGNEDGYLAGYDSGMGEGLEAGRLNGIEDGKTEAYHTFWDAFQDGGKRTDYTGEFGKKYWDDTTFKPKYNIVVVGSANQTFYNCAAMVFPVELDTSACTNMNYFFCKSNFKSLPEIDARGIGSSAKISYFLYNCPNLESIERVFLHGGTMSNCFGYLPKLVEVRFDGHFVSDLDMTDSPLSRASLESTVAALSPTATGLSAVFNKTAVEAAFTEEEWTALCATRPNWTIAKA